MPDPVTPTPTTPTPAAPARKSSADRPAEILVEIANDHNNQVLFPPLQERLRGRWDGHNLPRGDQSEAGLHEMPVIPGVHLRVDPSNSTLELIDPLALPENERLLARVSEVHQNIWGKTVRPRDGIRKERVSADDLATWLYWIERLVATNHARVLRGKLPSSEDVQRAFPDAKIRRDFFSVVGGGAARAG